MFLSFKKQVKSIFNIVHTNNIKKAKTTSLLCLLTETTTNRRDQLDFRVQKGIGYFLATMIVFKIELNVTFIKLPITFIFIRSRRLQQTDVTSLTSEFRKGSGISWPL